MQRFENYCIYITTERAISSLKKENIVMLNSDKGNVAVAMNKVDYQQKKSKLYVLQLIRDHLTVHSCQLSRNIVPELSKKTSKAMLFDCFSSL